MLKYREIHFQETNLNFTIKRRILVFEKSKQGTLFLEQAQLTPATDNNTSISLNIPPKTPMHLHKPAISTLGLGAFISGDGSKAGI